MGKVAESGPTLVGNLKLKNMFQKFVATAVYFLFPQNTAKCQQVPYARTGRTRAKHIFYNTIRRKAITWTESICYSHPCGVKDKWTITRASTGRLLDWKH